MELAILRHDGNECETNEAAMGESKNDECDCGGRSRFTCVIEDALHFELHLDVWVYTPHMQKSVHNAKNRGKLVVDDRWAIVSVVQVECNKKWW